jgi:hypothetical protein
MAFDTFDLGNVLQTAEAIKGARRQENIDRLREQYLGGQVQQQQQAQQTALDSTRASQVIAKATPILSDKNPAQYVQQYEPDLVPHLQQMGVDVNDNDQVLKAVTILRNHAYETIGQAPPQQMQDVGDVNHPENGLYQRNPVDNTLKVITAPQKPDTMGQARLDEEKRHNLAIEGKSATGGSVYDPETRRTAAIVVASDPTRIRDYASYGATGQAAKIEIQKEITNLKKETGMSDGDFVAARSRAKAEAGNLQTLTKQQAQVAQAEELAKANGDRLLQLFDLVDQTGIPAIEGITRQRSSEGRQCRCGRTQVCDDRIPERDGAGALLAIRT